MNCKPLDMAVIIRCSRGMEWSLGRIVQVMVLVQPQNCTQWEWGWTLAEPIKHPEQAIRYDRVMDSCLRPLRDHGDDAVDEMLRPLPSEVPA